MKRLGALLRCLSGGGVPSAEAGLLREVLAELRDQRRVYGVEKTPLGEQDALKVEVMRFYLRQTRYRRAPWEAAGAGPGEPPAKLKDGCLTIRDSDSGTYWAEGAYRPSQDDLLRALLDGLLLLLERSI